MTTIRPVRGHDSSLRIGVLGMGAIGSVVADRLAGGAVPGVRLSAVVTRRPAASPAMPHMTIGEAIECSDVIVECAGQQALRHHGPAVVAAGTDLVVTSVGALADSGTATALLAGPGQVHCTNGAIGGLDLLAAASDAGGFERVRITTTKLPRTLVQPWMEAGEAARLQDATGRCLVFHGTPAEAAERFPASLNVAVTVALSVGPDVEVAVELYADPAAELTRHEIEASGGIGHYRWEIENRPSPANPRSSAVVPFSILRTLSRLGPCPPLVL